MKILPILFAGSALVAATGAAAQSQPEQDAATTATAAQAPAPAEDSAVTTDDTATQAETTFTDAQVASFAAAAVKIGSLDKSQPATQEQLTQIVTESGIDPATYVAINNAMTNDEQLMQRVQVAAAALKKNSAG